MNPPKCKHCKKGNTFMISNLYDDIKKKYEKRFLCMICGKVTTRWIKDA